MIDKIENDQMKRLVDALMFAFKIKADNSLVGILGTGSESSNQEALTNWVHKILTNPDVQIIESVLPTLIDRLEESLRNEGEKY